ncbi:MAG: hypothetical protein IIC80_08305, partial [Chloroflexi bacterium]|nr:hypothetical protein [Chloroflexota bacterium]
MELRFRNQNRTAGFVLYESIAVQRIGDSDVVPVSIGGVEGEMFEDEERQLLSLAWPGNGVSFALIAFMSGALTKDEVMRIAESTLSLPAGIGPGKLSGEITGLDSSDRVTLRLERYSPEAGGGIVLLAADVEG